MLTSRRPKKMSTSRPPGPHRKRGHQHHPRNEGTRRKPILEPVVVAPLSVYSTENVLTTDQERGVKTLSETVVSGGGSLPKAKCDIPVIDLTQCDDETVAVKAENLVSNQEGSCSNVEPSVTKSSKNDRNQRIKKAKKSRSKLELFRETLNSPDKEDMTLVQRSEAEGSSLSDQETEKLDLDPETEELSKLRCTSERTEVIAEKEMRRKGRRCADYPGLAFSSTFSSDTMIKFNIIRNEIQNIMNTQLKRVGSFFFFGPVTAPKIA